MIESISQKKKTRIKNRKKQLRINQQLKKKLYKNISIAPCLYCRFTFLIDELTIEHIIPLSFGGTNYPANIGLACAPCNQKMGREAWMSKKTELRKKYEGYVNGS